MHVVVRLGSQREIRRGRPEPNCTFFPAKRPASPTALPSKQLKFARVTAANEVPSPTMDPWVQEAAAEIGRRAVRELEALVGVSSPSGDVHGAEECAAVCAALLPDKAEIERIPCSSPDHAPDLLARIKGTGVKRVLLLGHLDTVVPHQDHKPLTRQGDKLVGSGAVDMKGGDVLAMGVMRALAKRPERYAELALLLVCDEEWRTGSLAHVGRFAGWDACLCFEGGEQTSKGEDALVVRRKAAGTIHVTAHGRAAHSGSAPDRGRNALLALASAAQAVAAAHDPHGPQHLTSVPTVLRSGDAFNVVPGYGELFCDCRADDLSAIEAVLDQIPGEVGGVTLHGELMRRWPGMHSERAVAPILAQAAATLGRPVRAASRGGASDASHFAAVIPITIDGLGPRGGKAHNPGEFVYEHSLVPRAEVALAVAAAVL
jgi:glutamate carboxypeptidase